MSNYSAFLASKLQLDGDFGFEPLFLPDFLFDFQRHLVEWAVRKGRAALFEDCGLGKTGQQLVFAENVVRKTNKPVLVMTPLAVSQQTAREAEKFGIEAKVCRDGSLRKGIVITNYERLHHFNPDDFAGCVCDESSILKNFDGVTKAAITEFMRRLPYRLLCSATAAPNDYPELGTSSEALGEMGYMDMLNRFFKASNNANASGGRRGGRFDKNPFDAKFRFRGHAERDFWRWVCSWARAVRKPSDLGYEDGRFVLPELIVRHQEVEMAVPDGNLFHLHAVGLKEQRQESRRSLSERCAAAVRLIDSSAVPSIAWCNLNDEGDLITAEAKGACQVSGSDSDERKEEVFEAFIAGQVKVLVSKTQIAGFGLNFQHCAHQTFFASHSFEQWYQGVRRSWRFGQQNAVTIDMISTPGQAKVIDNLNRKAKAAEVMFSQLVELMNHELRIEKTNRHTTTIKTPTWL